MKQGKTLQELGRELQRQRNNRQDFLADTRSLKMESGLHGSNLIVSLDNKIQKFSVNEVAHQQIASRLNIPYRYYQKMQSDAPDLLDENVNRWLNQNAERRMIRVLDGNVRAFLSDRYRRLDNLELCAAVLPVIQEMKGANIESCEVTPTRMYLKVVNKRMKTEVEVGDVVIAGFVISNSEVGLGSLRVEPLIFRLVCKNGLICKDYSQKKYHVGKQVNLSDDSAYEIYSDETLAQDDKAFFMKVQDIVRAAVDENKFLMTVNKLRESTKIPLVQRCMFLPTLRAVANSLDRKITEPTVTELIAGTRETFLKKKSEYAVDPSSVLYALQGQAIHSINESHTQGEILSEERLKDEITSGQFDLFGKILDADDGVLGDLKVTSSFKIMKALGIYKEKVDTGEVYKSGLKKSLPKFKSELRFDGVKEVLEWAIQLNYYRMLLAKQGFKVSKMFIQAICRDSNLRMAAERGIDKTVYIIPINKISDIWLQKYFQHKAKILNSALKTKILPPVCSIRERWNDRKCLDYCAARENCPHAQNLLNAK